MRAILAGIICALAVTAAHAKPLDFGVKSPESMKATCAKVRGIFVDNEGKMSCVFARGTVRCDQDSHCYGYPRHPRPPVAATPLPSPVQPLYPGPRPPPLDPEFPDWQYHGNNYRW